MAYLSHHGIKGQKWGVKNGPPYPIVDKGVIKKGTVLSTVSGDAHDPTKDKNQTKISLFNPKNQLDEMVYKGYIAEVNLEKSGKLPTVHTYELTRDLKIATDKDRLNAFKQLYKENKKEIEDELKRIYNSKSIDNKKIELKTDEDFEKAFYLFVRDDPGPGSKDDWQFYGNKSLKFDNNSSGGLGQKYLSILSEKADISPDYNVKRMAEISQRPLMLLQGKVYTNDALRHTGSKALTKDEIDYYVTNMLDDTLYE